MELFSELRAGLEDEIAFHGSVVPAPLFSERVLAPMPADSPVRNLNTLDEVADYIDKTILIPIDEQRTRSVPGTGNPNADLVFIGEAPGADEDREGLPFVGRAGKLLNRLLAKMELDREEIFITNILKTRPPKNRNPWPDEIRAHFPLLMRQLSLINPKVLCCLGRVSGNAMLGTSQSLGAMRQQAHSYCGIPLFVTYHPAALLRNTKYRWPTWEDMQALLKVYNVLRGA